MPKKDPPEPFRDPDSGVACLAYADFKVKVGAGSDGTILPKRLQFIVSMRVDETREQAVARQRLRIAAALGHQAGV